MSSHLEPTLLSYHLLDYLVPLLSLPVTVLTLARMLPGRIARALQDHPNARSLHAQPVPRIGGLGMAAGLATVLAVTLLSDQPAGMIAPGWLMLAMGYGLLVLLSLADDHRPLPAEVRLPVHLTVCAALLAVVGVPLVWLAPLAFGLAWCANLFNFMDGADGLAGGMAVAGFGAFAAAGALAGDATLAVVSASLVAAALGFLRFNRPPASLFMGDAGSVPLGFAAGAIGVMGVRDGLWSPAFPLIAFFPFVFDASLTLARRILTGQRFWLAHREHLYQRLVLAGMSHRALALRAWALMGLCAVLALVTRQQPVQAWSVLGVLCVVGLGWAWRVWGRSS